MIGKDVEKRGIVSAGAELFTAIARTRVPRLCIVLRRAYTAGLYAMSGSGFLPVDIYALPGASIAVYGPEAVARFMDRLDLPSDQKNEIERKIEKESSLEFLVEQGFLNGIIDGPCCWKYQAICAFFRKKTPPASALTWRMNTRTVFEEYLDNRGMIAEAFLTDIVDGKQRSFYRLCGILHMCRKVVYTFL